MTLAGTWGRKCEEDTHVWKSLCMGISVPSTKKLYLRGSYRGGRPWLRLQSARMATYEEAICEGGRV